MSDTVLNNDGTLTIQGKIKGSIIVEVGDPNSSVPGVSGENRPLYFRSSHCSLNYFSDVPWGGSLPHDSIPPVTGVAAETNFVGHHVSQFSMILDESSHEE